MSLLCLADPPGWSMCSALCILIVLLPEAKADSLNTTTQFNGGGTQCGEYTNQVITANIERNNNPNKQETFLLSAYSFNPRDTSTAAVQQVI